MYADVQNRGHRHVSFDELLRWSGGACALVLLLIWITLVTIDAITRGLPSHPAIAAQIVPLAVIFVGYVVGWRHNLVGGALVVIGMTVFFAATWFASGWWPHPMVAWFAAPGVLYLLAWLCGRRSCAS